MAIFTAYAPPGAADAAVASDDILFLREGFSWMALLFAPVWAIVRGTWIVLLVWIAAVVLASLIAARFGEMTGLVVYVGVALWFGLEARNLRGAHLARRGWQIAGIVAAASAREAEERFFAKLAGDAVDGRLPPPLPRAPLRSRHSGFPPVVGYVAGGEL
ncbi:MAG: DUF2628 domain-containing protein [Ancalomicrobiaceae bacterium]|nr:DUF2628 domain-containing protein [Ancalomicrobiaceae bacterium]